MWSLQKVRAPSKCSSETIIITYPGSRCCLHKQKGVVASFLDDHSPLLDRMVKLSNNIKNAGLAGMFCFVWSCVATGLIQQVVLDFGGPVKHSRLSFTSGMQICRFELDSK